MAYSYTRLRNFDEIFLSVCRPIRSHLAATIAKHRKLRRPPKNQKSGSNSAHSAEKPAAPPTPALSHTHGSESAQKNAHQIVSSTIATWQRIQSRSHYVCQKTCSKRSTSWRRKREFHALKSSAGQWSGIYRTLPRGPLKRLQAALMSYLAWMPSKQQ